jgi:hypothetical protein
MILIYWEETYMIYIRKKNTENLSFAIKDIGLEINV